MGPIYEKGELPLKEIPSQTIETEGGFDVTDTSSVNFSTNLPAANEVLKVLKVVGKTIVNILTEIKNKPKKEPKDIDEFEIWTNKLHLADIVLASSLKARHD